MAKHFDFLVIGSGIAGISFAIKLAEKFPVAKIALVTKADENESNTKYAQGGIAVVTDQADSIAQHVADTLQAGDGLCDPKVVNFVVAEGPQRLRELVQWQVEFDRAQSGDFDRGLEGGHTGHRILHHKDKTGLEIELKLLQQVAKLPNIHVCKKHMAVALIGPDDVDDCGSKNCKNQCFGAYVLAIETGEIVPFLAPQTMLATGGIGNLYAHTTNPEIATGDGIAMAANLGAQLADMEFIQFHPTALYNPAVKPSFLISEAVRGFGAKLRNKSGKRFMDHAKAELAPRDIVARAIYAEMQQTNQACVFLDCTQLNHRAFVQHFPIISNRLKDMGIDVATQPIPVVPAAHYLCGGIAVNEYGQTSVSGLFATGECARTGLHGANRLASNSLLEALVFSHRSFVKASEHYTAQKQQEVSAKPWPTKGCAADQLVEMYVAIQQELRQIMHRFVGIVRTDAQLNHAAKQLQLLAEKVTAHEKEPHISSAQITTKNMLVVAQNIVAASRLRTKNAGTFFKVE